MLSLLGLLAKIKAIFYALLLVFADLALEPWNFTWKPLAFTRNPSPIADTFHLRALYLWIPESCGGVETLSLAPEIAVGGGVSRQVLKHWLANTAKSPLAYDIYSCIWT